MQIREAHERDLEAISHLYSVLRPNDPKLNESDALRSIRRVLLSNSVKLFVAEIDGLLVSTCMLASFPSFASGGRPIGVIEHVVTLPEFRGRGLAKLTLSAALEHAWNEDCCKVFLLSGRNRADAHELYESLGFNGDIERGFVIKSQRKSGNCDQSIST